MKSSRRRVVSSLIQCLLMKGLAHWMKIHWNRRLMFYCGYRRATGLVGIISHVGELKERIGRQIVVTKTPDGGSHARIVADN